MKEIYQGLPSWAKGVVVVGGFAIVYFTGRSLWKKLNEINNLKNIAKESDNAKNELYRLAQQSIRPTLNQTQLEGMSQQLVSSFNGCGTDENAIASVFRRIRNDADVYALITTYGARKYDDCNLTEGFGDTTASLSSALVNEMNRGDIKTYVNDVLQSKGVSFRF